jgi:hypothetical protein
MKTVWIYVDTSKQVGDVDHLKVFESPDLADEWLEENDPEGVVHIMEYRGIDYTAVQGVGRQLWKWAVSIDAKPLTGQAATKSEAVAEAERAIDRALAPKKLRLVRPEREA